MVQKGDGFLTRFIALTIIPFNFVFLFISTFISLFTGQKRQMTKSTYITPTTARGVGGSGGNGGAKGGARFASISNINRGKMPNMGGCSSCK